MAVTSWEQSLLAIFRCHRKPGSLNGIRQTFPAVHEQIMNRWEAMMKSDNSRMQTFRLLQSIQTIMVMLRTIWPIQQTKMSSIMEQHSTWKH
jgi:hypothetical protein